METFGKRSQMILANLSEVRGQLDRGCELQKSDGGFRMIDWMVSLGALYRNCLANVRKVEQNGENLDIPPHISAYKPVGILSFSAVLSWRFLLAMPIFIHFFRDLLSPGTIH